MGTSVSHRSPDTLNWRAVAATYLSESLPIERITQEIWRAATNQGEDNLVVTLSEPIISECLKTVMSSDSVQDAVGGVASLIASSGDVSIATDIARRATVTSFLRSGNRRMNFVSSLFAEAVDYLVSRDLSGYVGLGNRVSDVSSSMALKQDIKSQVIHIIEETPLPEKTEEDADNWREYVLSQTRRLTKIPNHE